jgi:hypothetical protein
MTSPESKGLLKVLKKIKKKKKILEKFLNFFFLGTPFSKHVATLVGVVKCAPLEFTFRPTGQKTDTMATLD